MADTHETIDGLLAEFRGYLAGLPASYHFTVSCRDIRLMLDRLEAAHRRELSKNVSKKGADFGQLGNAAKLRESLEKAAESAAEIMERVRHKDGLAFNTANYIAGIAKDALASPARNCDVGTAEEQAKRMDKFCDSHGHGFDGYRTYACENCQFISVDRCELAWSQMPYEGGGNDGNE